jgi:two-component system phosphate regulon response regulator PhoB
VQGAAVIDLSYAMINVAPRRLHPTMTPKQILIVEDERPIREMIAFGLKRAGFEVREAEDSRSARSALADRRPDLILIDWMLPDSSGLELTRALKRERETRDLPIIMLTARAAEADKVAGLDGGADDYLTKPFSPRELLARVNALLRRVSGTEEGEALTLGLLTLDRAGHRVSAAGRAVPLGPTEYRLLEFFMLHADRVYSREQLLDRVWGGNVYVEERTIDVHIRRLRKALEDFACSPYIQTVRGTGYRFSVRVDA